MLHGIVGIVLFLVSFILAVKGPSFNNKQSRVQDSMQKSAPLLQRGHKGYGLSLMVEILCALLSSMPFGPHVGNMYKDPIDKKRNLGHFFMAIDVNSFVEISSFKNRLNELLNELRQQVRINPDMGIKVAGDNENIISLECKKNGIPLDKEEALIFLNLSKDYKLNLNINKKNE